MTKLLRILPALLLENDPPVPKNQRETFLLLIFTVARKFQDSAFWRSFGVLNFRVLCLNDLDAEKEIAELWVKVNKNPGFKTLSFSVPFLLLFPPLAKGFERKRLSDRTALTLKIHDNMLKAYILSA
ncbi:MAG: hypothetical protein LBR53_03290 [Deltaproteobacteria bacterium]|jgi:hypothetical protein|nr:hypothetical protein [Deltaproteobacteria bacterium]